MRRTGVLMEQILQEASHIYTYSFPKQLHVRTYEKGDDILHIGNDIDGLYFLVRGAYYVTSLEANGKELLLRRCTPPSILGDVELFQHCTIQSNCRATEHCIFLFVPTAFYDKMLQHDVSFTTLLLTELAFKLKTCTTLSRVNALSSVSVKLAAYVCTMYERQEPYLHVEHLHDIARLLGTTSRHVNRVLKRWEDDALISRIDTRIHVHNYSMLDILSEGIRYGEQ